MKGNFGLYKLALERLVKLRMTRNGIVRFPDVFEKLCSSFQITKVQCWELLFLLREFGIIKIVRGHGIKIENKRTSGLTLFE